MRSRNVLARCAAVAVTALLLLALTVCASPSSASDLDDDEFDGASAAAIVVNPSNAIADANLASLLLASSRRALISVTASEFERWAEGVAAHDRHYTLLLFFTASQQCAACRTVEKELASVAALYEQTRYPSLEQGSSLAAHSSHHHPAHHIFFLSFDAHRDDTGEGPRGSGMRNLAWFQKRKLTKVPELIMLEFTVPEGMKRGAGRVTVTAMEDDVQANATAQGKMYTAVSRLQERLAAMRLRRWEKQQARANASQVAATAAAVNTTEPAVPAEASTAPPATPATAASAAATTPAAPAPAQVQVSWRDPNQTVSYPLSAGVQAAQLMAWVRLHTEKFVVAGGAGGEDDDDNDAPLHRSQVVRPHGLSFDSVDGSAAASSASSSESGALVRWFWNLQPFLSSFLLFAFAFTIYKMGHARFALVPVVVYLWSVVGAMNNILKDMPLIGINQQGPVIFYPGHGSFVAESILIALIYGYCSYAIISLNGLDVWMPWPSKVDAVAAPAVAAPTTTPSDATAAASSTPTASAEVSASATPRHVLQPHQIRAPKSLLAAQKRQAEEEADQQPFVLTTAQWLMFFVASLAVAFSLLRSIYTRKNPRYNWGYLI